MGHLTQWAPAASDMHQNRSVSYNCALCNMSPLDPHLQGNLTEYLTTTITPGTTAEEVGGCS